VTKQPLKWTSFSGQFLVKAAGCYMLDVYTRAATTPARTRIAFNTRTRC
jgi:hypothetical protein